MYRTSRSLAIIFLLMCGMSYAQVGTGTSHWDFTGPKPYHSAVLKLRSDSYSGLPEGCTNVGSCTVVSFNGKIFVLSAYHVLAFKNQVSWVTIGGKYVRVRVVYDASENTSDYVIMQFEEDYKLPDSIKPAKLGLSAPKYNDNLVLCGYGGSSKKLRSYSAKTLRCSTPESVVSDAVAIPGDSGGGMFNDKGELVGVISGGWLWCDHIKIRPGGEESEATFLDALKATGPVRGASIEKMAQGFVQIEIKNNAENFLQHLIVH